MNVENVHELLDLLRLHHLDSDGSGDLTLSELVLGGGMSKAQAEELFDRCRRKRDAAISDKARVATKIPAGWPGPAELHQGP